MVKRSVPPPASSLVTWCFSQDVVSCAENQIKANYSSCLLLFVFFRVTENAGWNGLFDVESFYTGSLGFTGSKLFSTGSDYACKHNLSAHSYSCVTLTEVYALPSYSWQFDQNICYAWVKATLKKWCGVFRVFVGFFFFFYTVKMLKSENLMIAQSKSQLKCISVIQRKRDFDLIVLCDIYEKPICHQCFNQWNFKKDLWPDAFSAFTSVIFGSHPDYLIQMQV